MWCKCINGAEMSSFANSAKSPSSFDIWNAKKDTFEIDKASKWMMISCKWYINGNMFGITKISKNIYFFFNDVVIDEKDHFCHEMSSTWHFVNDSRWPHNTKWFLLDDVMPLNQIIAIRWSEFHNFRWKDSSNRHQSSEKNFFFHSFPSFQR